MANDEHVAILKKGVYAWNEWRRKNLNIIVSLRGANLSEAFLIGVTDLSEANLSEANLSEANLMKANLIGAHLTRANRQ
jgi:uncharacterized protein YjbI with pentapeptide repeats